MSLAPLYISDVRRWKTNMAIIEANIRLARLGEKSYHDPVYYGVDLALHHFDLSSQMAHAVKMFIYYEAKL